MKGLKIPYAIIYLLLLIPIVSTQNIKEIKGPNYEGEETMDKYVKLFKIIVTDKTKYIKVQTTPIEKENPINFFIDTVLLFLLIFRFLIHFMRTQK